MFDYEKDRMTGKQCDVAVAAHEQVLKICQEAAKKMVHPGEQACLLAGLAIPPLAGLAFLFGRHQPDEIGKPSIDDIIFGAMYVACSIEEHQEGLVAGFTSSHVIKAKDMFKTLMGRDYPLDPRLQAVLDVITNQAVDKTPDHLKKFVS